MSDDIRVHIPDYQIAEAHVGEGIATELEKFICEFEPIGESDVEWRCMLAAVIREAASNERDQPGDWRRMAL